MLRRRVASCCGVEIFSGLLAFDNYVPSELYRVVCERKREREREEEGKSRGRESESCEAVFSSLGVFVLRGQENSAGKIIFLSHSSPPLRCVQQLGWGRLCRSSVIVSTDSHRFLFPLSALFYSPSSRGFILQRRIFLGSLLSSPFLAEYHLLFLCSQLFLLTVVRSCTCVPIHYTHSQLFIPRTCVRIHSRSSIPRVSPSFTLHLLFLFFRFHPRPLSHGAIYESERYGVSSTVICLRRLIMAALLLSWISTSY